MSLDTTPTPEVTMTPTASITAVSTDVICRIVTGELDAAIVHRDDRFIAFLDHRPVFKGHVLIAPVRHIDDLLALPATEMQSMLGLGQRVTRAQMSALGAQGSFIAINTIISQSVPHLHMHVVPRSKGDGLLGFFWPRTRYSDGEAAEYAERISAAMADNNPAEV